MSDPIVLRGRRFRAVQQPTLRHQVFVTEVEREAGLVKATMLPDEQPDDFAVRLVQRANQAGVLYLLLGAMLVPEELQDLDWRPELARETAELVANVQDPDELARVHRFIGEALLPFLTAGIASWTRTRVAFDRAMATAGEESSSSTRSSSRAGATRSTPWWAGIRWPWRRSSTGRSRPSSGP